MRRGLTTIALGTAIALGAGAELSCGGAQKARKAPPEATSQKIERLGKNYKQCLEVIPGHNDVRKKRLNIVLVGVNYTSDKLKKKVSQSVDEDGKHGGILAVEPFKSNKHNLNFWYVPKSAMVMDKKTGEDARGSEAWQPAITLARKCRHPSRTLVALVNWDFRSNASYSGTRGLDFHKMNLTNLGTYQRNFAKFTRHDCRAVVPSVCEVVGEDSEFNPLCDAVADLRGLQDPKKDARICSIITQGEIPFGMTVVSESAGEQVVVHELGHSVFGLYDEYNEKDKVKPARYASYLEDVRENPMNCYEAPDKQTCEAKAPWAGISDSCYLGCRYAKKVGTTKMWRSVKRGKMKRSYQDYFGAWNEAIGCNVLEVTTQNAHGICEKYGHKVGAEAIGIPIIIPDDSHDKFLLDYIDPDKRVE